jgi:CBS domain-containing protein
MNVDAILRTKGNKVETVQPGISVAEAVGLLTARRIGALVVSEDGRRVDGILSERDVVHALGVRGAGILDAKVGELMTHRVQTCSPEDSIEALMNRMTEGRFRHMPVVRDGRLCGIISIGDVVKNRLDEVEYEASSLKSFITSA